MCGIYVITFFVRSFVRSFAFVARMKFQSFVWVFICGFWCCWMNAKTWNDSFVAFVCETLIIPFWWISSSVLFSEITYGFNWKSRFFFHPKTKNEISISYFRKKFKRIIRKRFISLESHSIQIDLQWAAALFFMRNFHFYANWLQFCTFFFSCCRLVFGK